MMTREQAKEIAALRERFAKAQKRGNAAIAEAGQSHNAEIDKALEDVRAAEAEILKLLAANTH
jgi:hypothetical protein